jgi:TetR/AcrR family transcriptional regulator, repressor for uid operon
MAPETARLLTLAFDPEVRTADDALSNRILDAALALAAASGLRHLTMDDVARRAGVGRMTVYRRFGSKTALVDALAVRECRSCLARIAAALPSDGELDERMAALFATTLTVIREHPLLERLARVEPESLLQELTRDDSAVFRLVREFLIGLITEGQAARSLPAGDPAVIAELWLRLGASFVLMPDTIIPVDDHAALRRLIGTLLLARTLA